MNKMSVDRLIVVSPAFVATSSTALTKRSAAQTRMLPRPQERTDLSSCTLVGSGSSRGLS
ncbi:hypothetical protein [Arthrobacter sp. AQ5-05]|uniref:hypothetical protein n=1 Tax=Arthrobacter sp. AQ5-05 TaxID=2184581 RepID=UPI0011BF8054|nr:hypothetical protein [Arthrobacter sp. AQ5-05]